MRVVINGFGRIGRTILRQLLTRREHDDIEVVLIQDLAPIESCAYLFKYDSTFGPFPGEVTADGDALHVAGRRIAFSRNGAGLGSQDLSGVDVVLECTGRIASRQAARSGIDAGARAVLISGPSDHADVTIVKGANGNMLGDAAVVANSSCTTNAIAPLLRALDAGPGIVRAHVTTIHCYTGSQPMVDAARGDPARSRAGAESMVPTTTSASKELQKVLGALAARTTVAAVRVPCLSVSAIDATLQLTAPARGAPAEILRDIARRTPEIGFTDDPCVSRDMRGRPESIVLALPETMALEDTQLRVFGWYDNEWGFSARMIEMARLMAARSQDKEETRPDGAR